MDDFARSNVDFLVAVIDSVFMIKVNAGWNFDATEQYRLALFVEDFFEEAFSTETFVNRSVNIRYINAPCIDRVRFRADFE